jgi:hypothetical protein
MTEERSVSITDLSDPPTDEEILALPGSVIQLVATDVIPAEGASLFDLFGFARVLLVANRDRQDKAPCSVCETENPRFELRLEWESYFDHAPYNTACENCIQGVASKGIEHIGFGENESTYDGFTLKAIKEADE